MSRFQEYLRTPNALPRIFFSPKSCLHDQAQDLFADQQGQQTKGHESCYFDQVPQSHESCENLIVSTANLPIILQPNMIKLKLDFGNEMNQQIKTPVKGHDKEVNIITTAQKKYDLRQNVNSTAILHDGKQTERTLRLLAAEAYNIVCQKGSSTYRQVSECIINDSSGLLSTKQQKNIKRRVYDALNVLIALGQLEKRGRKILPKKKPQKDKIKKDEIMELKRTLQQKQNIVKIKRRHLKEQLKKNQNTKKLIERNARSLAKGNISQAKIAMPFVLASYSSRVSLSQEKTEAKIMIDQNDTNGGIFIDINALEFIKFHNK